MAKDFYKTLGVSKSSTPDEIKKAYRKLAVEFHPDRNKSKEAEDKFKEISEAYEVLSDPKKKQAYDQYGDAAFQNGAGGQGPFGQGFGGQQGPFRYQYYSNGGGQQGPFDFGNFQDPFDIFEQFFGGGMGQPRKPQYALRIEFMEAVKGTTRRINVNGKEKEIKIPPGVDTGSRINFDDFTIIIEARGDSRFQRQGADIVTEEKITFTQATLGDTIEVKTVQGDVKLKIPEGTQPDALIRIKDKGMPHVKGSGKGDHYVRVKVEIPKKINGRQKELLTEFAEESKKRHWF